MIWNTPEWKVGILVVGVSSLIGVMSLRVAEGPGLFNNGQKFHFTLDDAGGVVKGSAVKMAGIKVGTIEDIVLKDSKAQIELSIDKDVPITSSAKAELRTDGILGDKHVEIVPGNPADAKLTSGSELPSSGNGGGLDKMVNQISELMTNLNKATKEGDNSTMLGRIVINIEKITHDLADLTGDNKAKVGEIVDNLRELTGNLKEHINDETLARLDKTIQNVEDITTRINKGEGTIGRLINDEETVEELNSAITNVNRFLGGMDKMELSVDFHSEYLTSVDMTKSYLGLKIQPGLDRYYMIQLVDDPRGVSRTNRVETTPLNGSTSTVDERVIYYNKVKFTGLFAKNFYDFTLKGGLIEDTGGFGIDYHMFDRQVQVSAEFFNFRDLYARSYVRYNFMKGVYAIAGGDNLFSADQKKSSAFVGAGLFITNDDLKVLATKMSFR